MTVTAAEARVEYAGNGVTFIFAYPYQFFEGNDLDVWLFDDATGVGTQQVIGTDYTVSGVLNPTGGNVTFAVPPPGGHTVIIINSPDIVQTLHYVNADDFPADSHEQGLDRLTKICQRLSDRIDRAVRAPDYAPEDDVPDADTLVNLVEEAQDAATDSANSAAASAGSANNAQASQTAASTSAANAASSATAANNSASAAATSASNAAASAAAAQVAKIVWRGAWGSATAYVPNDAVQSGGSSWVSKTNNTNKTPAANPSDWDLMAQKGADGTGGGGGGGDMLRANNLSDVLDASVSLANIGGAPKNSPAFTGNPTAPTPAANDNDTSIATTAFVTTAITGKADKSYVDSQNATQDVNIADKISHLGDTMTGQLGLPTGPSANHAVRRDYVDAADALLAPKANPVFTGNPQAPTPIAGDNDTSIATTAFVKSAIDVAIAGIATPLGKQVGAMINQSLTTGLMGFYSGNTSIFIMKDGTVRSAGAPGTDSFNRSLAKGSGGNAATTFDLRKVGLPAGLLGTPVSVFHTGGESFILTDQGDVCGAGRNTVGQLGVGDTAVREIFTLLSAAAIGPRSAGGTARKVTNIIVSVNQYNPATPNAAPVWFLCADNTLWGCGINTANQLGVGDAINKNVPTQCLKNDGAGNVAIADCAKAFAFGNDLNSIGYIDTSGKLRLAGRLSSGAIGRNSSTGNSSVFRPVFTTTDNAASDLPPTYQALELYESLGETMMVRCADKCLYAWGANGQGQCGLANTTQQLNPKKVGTGTAVAAAFNGNVERVFLSAAVNNPGNFIAQMTDGTVYCWGSKASNNLPITAADGSISTPVNAQGLLSGAGIPVINRVFGNTVAGTGTGNQTLFMWLADGRILTWGPIAMNGVSSGNSANPQQVAVPSRPGNPTIVAAGCGGDQSGNQTMVVWLILSDGTLLVMGNNPPDGIGGSSFSFNEASIP
jgi:alpha-tubulin suppressor-like RCC1 family protein